MKNSRFTLNTTLDTLGNLANFSSLLLNFKCALTRSHFVKNSKSFRRGNQYPEIFDVAHAAKNSHAITKRRYWDSLGHSVDWPKYRKYFLTSKTPILRKNYREANVVVQKNNICGTFPSKSTSRSCCGSCCSIIYSECGLDSQKLALFLVLKCHVSKSNAKNRTFFSQKKVVLSLHI